MRSPRALVLFGVLLAVAVASAQAPDRDFPTYTTLDALTRFPNFYHLKAIVVRGELKAQGNSARLVPPGGLGRGVELLLRGDPPPEGVLEARGQFWDVGRLSPDDPHAAAYQLPALVQARMGDRWPAQGEMLVVNLSSAAAAQPPSPRPSIRQIALDPEHYEGQTVTVSGQFAGRNLLGDLPQAPRVSRTDFVIRNAGGAVWVSGAAPVGRGWMLDPTSRLDTDRWLRVEGVVRHGEGLVWIEAKGLAQATAQAEPADAQEPAPVVLPAPPPEVRFTLPAQDETDVPATTSVKIQTTRDLDPDSFEKHIVVTYLGQPPNAPGVPFKATFDRANRVLELKFDQPLERFRTVKVDLLEGVKGTDGQPMKPFTLTFSVGG